MTVVTRPSTRMSRHHRYAPVGTCIYCGTTAGRLTDEHIIPESFGGALLLPTASCDDCARETHAFEGRCAGQLFRPARRALRLPQRNRNAKAKVPETFDADIDEKPVKVAVADFPPLLITFAFDPPGIIVNQPPNESFSGRGGHQPASRVF
ncbi:HNH endonuclease [Bosea vestrisii]|uniref:HNH endonuclease n=1 Tax=Bosea vestrisii TaxID=151416 RepID=UPI003D767692